MTQLGYFDKCEIYQFLLYFFRTAGKIGRQGCQKSILEIVI